MDKDELKKKLTTEEYQITQEKGTEVPFSGEYWNTKDVGMYTCKVCGQELFSSDAKVDSSTGPAGLQGWPAFEDALRGSVTFVEDTTMGMHRTEAVCSKCGAHLGHLFDDEGTKTGKHFCANSASLCFNKKDEPA